MISRNRRLYAVLIDADNIPAKFTKAILKEISSFGEPALRRVYGDWSRDQMQGWTDTIRTNGLVAHQETQNTQGKNASDIGLVIDAMDILHTGRFDGFVIVSSDSDFTALANRIREQGLDVIGIGERKTPDSLRSVCNRFILIENLIDTETPAINSKQDAIAKLSPNKAVPLITAAMAKMDQEHDWHPLSALGSRLTAMQSDFDTRTYGHGKLSDLLKSIDKFEVRKTGNSISVRLVKR